MCLMYCLAIFSKLPHWYRIPRRSTKWCREYSSAWGIMRQCDCESLYDISAPIIAKITSLLKAASGLADKRRKFVRLCYDAYTEGRVTNIWEYLHVRFLSWIREKQIKYCVALKVDCSYVIRSTFAVLTLHCLITLCLCSACVVFDCA